MQTTLAGSGTYVSVARKAITQPADNLAQRIYLLCEYWPGLTMMDNNTTNSLSSALTQDGTDALSRFMFCLSVVFIALLGTLIVVGVDIPRVAELHALELAKDPAALPAAATSSLLAPHAGAISHGVNLLLIAIWPIFWLEYLYTNSITRSDRKRPWPLYGLLACVLPPLRLATRNPDRQGEIWLPFLQWQKPGRALSRQLEKTLSKPMLMVGLLILPILLVEYGLQDVVRAKPWLQDALHIATGFIWCAFTMEFIVMLGSTDRKMEYIKSHLIDLAIILLPLLSFLRSIQALRIAKIAKIQKIAKMGRVFRVRGLLIKMMRALLLMEVVSRLFRITPEKKLQKLKADYQLKLEDLEELQEEIDCLAEQIAEDRASELLTAREAH